MQKIDLMCPAGSFESLNAAINSGATSIYFGVGNLNMRSRSTNFEIQDINKIVEICKKNKIRTYLTLNTIMYNQDLETAKKLCDVVKEKGIDAIIASDLSVILYAKRIGIEIHISTQANISNIDAVKFYSQYADVIVLARELKLEQIKEINKQIKKEKICGPNGKLIKTEVFIHGALCIAISGKCYMSLANYNTSANKGACLQSCRRKYKVYDVETNKELIIDNEYVMSPSDLCTIEILDRIIDAGVSVLKIEGRARSPEYVKTTTEIYKKAIELIKEKKFNLDIAKKLKTELKNVFNRGFWDNGYYLGEKINEWANTYGSKAKKVKIDLGKVTNYYKKTGIVEIIIQSNELKRNDTILIIGPTTGVIEHQINGFLVNDKKSNIAKQKDEITFKLEKMVRKNDRVYIYREKEK